VLQDFWTFVRGFDLVLLVEVDKAEVLHEGPKRCGILNTVVILKTIKGSTTTRTLQIVSRASLGVDTRKLLLLSSAGSLERKDQFIEMTGCTANPYKWYYNGMTSQVLPMSEGLSKELGADVVEVPGFFFEDSPHFIPEDRLIDDGGMPIHVRDYRPEGSQIMFTFLSNIEDAVHGKKLKAD